MKPRPQDIASVRRELSWNKSMTVMQLRLRLPRIPTDVIYRSLAILHRAGEVEKTATKPRVYSLVTGECF